MRAFVRRQELAQPLTVDLRPRGAPTFKSFVAGCLLVRSVRTRKRQSVGHSSDLTRNLGKALSTERTETQVRIFLGFDSPREFRILDQADARIMLRIDTQYFHRLVQTESPLVCVLLF